MRCLCPGQAQPPAAGRLDPEVTEKIVSGLADACRANGKFAGVGGVADRELLRRYIGMGVRLVLPGSDLGFMASAASECAAAMRAFL